MEEKEETKQKENNQETGENKQETKEEQPEEQKEVPFNEAFLQLVLGLQSTAWISLGKVQNPQTGKQEVDINRARDAIDTLLALKEKTKGNLTQTEQGILENQLQDLEMNFMDVSRKEKEKPNEDSGKNSETSDKEPGKEQKSDSP